MSSLSESVVNANADIQKQHDPIQVGDKITVVGWFLFYAIA